MIHRFSWKQLNQPRILVSSWMLITQCKDTKLTMLLQSPGSKESLRVSNMQNSCESVKYLGKQSPGLL